MKKPFKLLINLLLIGLIIPLNAQQVKIADNSSATMNANSLLELESTTKGLLPPRVAINSLTAVSPLTGAVPAGMLVYSLGGTVTDGYYTWDGAKWLPFATGVGAVNVVAKTSTATLTKAETFVVASDAVGTGFTLTLPVVTSADNGLAITIKNTGDVADLITVVGNGAATIDGVANSLQTRWIAYTYIANGGSWILKNRVSQPDNLLDVSSKSSWTTIPEVITYLTAHMTGPTVVRLGGETFSLSATQTINLSFPVSFQGLTFGVTTITAASGFTGGLFSCATEAYFKFISFESTFGATSGHDAIRLTGSGKYHEIKDCVFTGFNKGINMTTNASLWVFECDFEDEVASGVEVGAGAGTNASFLTSESSFGNCAKGVNLLSGVNSTISIQNCTFNPSAGQVGLDYVPATFTSTTSMFFTNNTWNNVGTFVNVSGTGFDFTRTDGRDANMDIENNSGIESKNPKCKINVVNNVQTITCANTANWYKPVWTNTSLYTVNWNVVTTLNLGNKFTFLPTNTRDVFIILAGNVSVNGNNKTLNIGIVKNGVSAIRYGETTLRTVTSNQAYQYSTTIYIPNVIKTDFFEVWVNDATTNGDVVTFQDVNIFVNAQ